MELNVYKKDGTPSGEKVVLRPEIFEIEPNDHVLYLDVKAYLANQRQGTHKVKGRSEVSGGGRKPFRQKGTGRARQGTTRAVQMVGGGRAHGPRPRNYRQELPKKVKQLARRSALSYKAKEDKIIVVEDFRMDAPKTREVVDLLRNLKVDDHKVLILTSQHDLNFYKSARNIPYKWVLTAPQFSAYDVLHAQVLVIQKGAVDIVNEVLGQ
ncbi:MAG: 50S ribosomal protein L4 [Calditrichaceae bacterium]|nr:50S ribosomal protein L4 [Calditrichia bacterium]NUQ40462.1 50S ribosomal protein L4 [Calditrichaceae bacterium]